MALQQLVIDETNNVSWFKKSAVKVTGLFVAGLLFTAMLYNSQATSSRLQTAAPVTKHASACSSTNVKDAQCTSTATFSIMPGGLSRFLQ